MYNESEVLAKIEAIEVACFKLQEVREHMQLMQAGDYCAEELGGVGYSVNDHFVIAANELTEAAAALSNMLAPANNACLCSEHTYCPACRPDAVFTQDSELCDKAPSGWSCSRVVGHDGPCAAIEETRSIPSSISQRQLEFALNCLSVDNAMNIPDFKLAEQLFEKAGDYSLTYNIAGND